MWRFTWAVVKRVGKAVGYGAVGAVVVLIVVAVLFLESRPDLEVWHEARLDEEFTVKSDVDSFEQYLELEKRLFQQLEDLVYDRVDKKDQSDVSRYTHGSRADPGRWPRNWNRSFELAVDAPRAGVLLLHGMSDSPYSLRHFGVTLHGRGAHVIGLRVPGHGTAPSGLVHTRWPDMAAAVRLAVRHLRAKIGDKPLYLVGYSNGGSLAVHHALTGGDVDGIVLLSGAIGVVPVAALAIWQSRLGRWLGLHKLAWNALVPEYDPFKYGSFAVNAGVMVYEITTEIQARIDKQDMSEFPPLLAFQSAVDATVSAPALVRKLRSKLPPGGHELVVFVIVDLNRSAVSIRERPGISVQGRVVR